MECRIMILISIGSSSSGEAHCGIRGPDIIVCEFCTVDVGSNVFDMVGCECATRCSKGGVLVRTKDERRRRLEGTGHLKQ